jgi:hypothetical protein
MEQVLATLHTCLTQASSLGAAEEDHDMVIACLNLSTQITDIFLTQAKQNQPCPGKYWKDGACDTPRHKLNFDKRYKGPDPSKDDLCNTCGSAYLKELKKQKIK